MTPDCKLDVTGAPVIRSSTLFAAGDSVEICDGSMAHGDKGKVLWVQDDGLIIVELETGCVWPVTEDEIKPSSLH